MIKKAKKSRSRSASKAKKKEGQPCLGIDCREFEKGKKTGIARYLHDFILYLLRPGQPWDLRLFGNQFTEWESYIPDEVKRVIPEKWTIWWDQRTLPKHLKREQCELFVSPYFKAPLFAPCRVVLIINDLIPIRNLYFRVMMKWNLKRAAAIISISESVRNDIVDFCPEAAQKITVIPLGVSHQFSPGPEKKLFLKKEYGIKNNYLLYVGNANVHKNLKTLIRAMRNVPQHDLVLCGIDAQNTQSLMNYASNEEVLSKIHFINGVPDEDLLHLYRSADVFVFPSKAEGFGLPPLEAMACGVPVVASKIPVLEEVLGSAAVFADPNDPIDIASGIQSVLNESGLKNELIKKGKERAALFSEKEMVSSFNEFLKSVF